MDVNYWIFLKNNHVSRYFKTASKLDGEFSIKSLVWWWKLSTFAVVLCNAFSEL